MNMISDEMLRNTRSWLVERSTELRDRLQRVRSDLTHVSVPLSRDAPHAAIAVENDEILEAVEESARGELDQIERTVERLEAGTFGSCEVCGAEIDPKRLSVVPYTTRCARCAQDA